jgi:tetratricopeptide (TPR) repeat protein
MADDAELKAEAKSAVEQGAAAAKVKRWTDAVRHLQHALALYPAIGSADVHWGTRLCAEGVAPLRRGLDTALEFDPKRFSPLVNRSYIHLQCDRFAEALADAVAATNVNPSANRCAALNGLGLHSAAIRCGKRAVELMPTDPGAHRNLADALHKTGDLYGALSHFEQAIEHSSDAALTHELISERAACERDLRAQKRVARPLRSFGLWSCTVLLCALLIVFITRARDMFACRCR